MGPTLICDKSSLQCLSRVEHSTLRRYYSLNVPPILLIEILGDLKKHADSDEARKEVRIIANKILPACSSVNTDFRQLIRAELAGYRIEMSGVPILDGAKQVISEDGKKGFIFEESSASKALSRWQIGEFRDGEKILADAWRVAGQAIDLEAMQKVLKNQYSPKLTLRSLDATASFVDDILAIVPAKRLLEWFLHDASVPVDKKGANNIEKFGESTIRTLAVPYTAYCLRTALIFHFGLAFNLVSTRATNRLDLEYFYYVPFCRVFSSSDNFHQSMAPYILSECMFVTGHALKADLATLAALLVKTDANGHEGEKHSGPPENEGSVTYQAWAKNMKPGFTEIMSGVSKQLTPEASARLLEEFKKIVANESLKTACSISMDDCDFMVRKHSVRLDGPCICGSTKLFRDCCGQRIIAPNSPHQ